VRIVLDTNIIISGLLSETGPPGQLLRFWLEGQFELATSKAQLGELGRVFDYKKIRARIFFDQAIAFLDHIDTLAFVVDALPTVDLLQTRMTTSFFQPRLKPMRILLSVEINLIYYL
jgi:putative PIN family toxin of toxin-antitoxin system